MKLAKLLLMKSGRKRSTTRIFELLRPSELLTPSWAYTLKQRILNRNLLFFRMNGGLLSAAAAAAATAVAAVVVATVAAASAAVTVAAVSASALALGKSGGSD